MSGARSAQARAPAAGAGRNVQAGVQQEESPFRRIWGIAQVLVQFVANGSLTNDLNSISKPSFSMSSRKWVCADPPGC